MSDFIDFLDVEIKRVIFHTIHQKKRTEDHSEVTFSENTYDVPTEVKELMKIRLQDSLAKDSKSFEMSIDRVDPDSFFQKAREMSNLPEESFIAYSKSLATKLAEVQTRSNVPQSYLIFVDGRIEGKNIITVIKAELEEALTANEETSAFELLKDLFLSNNQKFYKIGVLMELNTDVPNQGVDNYRAQIYDQQFRANSTPARYFIEDFLGYSSSENLKYRNKNYVDEVVNMLNRSEVSFDEKMKALVALKTTIQNNHAAIDPADFGERHLSGSLRETYQEEILSRSEYQRPFEKDTALLKRKLKEIKVLFDDNKTKLYSKAEEADNILFISNEEELHEKLNQLNWTEDSLVILKNKKPNIS